MKKNQTPTELVITVSGDYTHEPPETAFEAKIQPIEKAAFSLQALFNSIRTAALCHEGEATAENAELGRFCTDLITLSEIGSGLCGSILRGSSELFDFQLKPDAPDQNVTRFETLTLPEQISLILKNPDLPTPIYDGLQDGIADASSVTDDDSEQPEYIARVIGSYRQKAGGESDES